MVERDIEDVAADMLAYVETEELNYFKSRDIKEDFSAFVGADEPYSAKELGPAMAYLEDRYEDATGTDEDHPLKWGYSGATTWNGVKLRKDADAVWRELNAELDAPYERPQVSV